MVGIHYFLSIIVGVSYHYVAVVIGEMGKASSSKNNQPTFLWSDNM
jgi:hypothetical protein